MPLFMTPIETVKALLAKTPGCEHNELLIECLPSVPNDFIKSVELRFSGWQIQLLPNGTWTVKDTGGLLKSTY